MFKMKSVVGFIIAITEQLEENRSLKVLAGGNCHPARLTLFYEFLVAHDDVWIAYFEGSVWISLCK